MTLSWAVISVVAIGALWSGSMLLRELISGAVEDYRAWKRENRK